MTDKKSQKPALPAKNPQQGKVQRALEIRESTSKAREGKPLAFPIRRAHR